MRSKKIATYGLLIALAFILSYIESLIPVFIAIPGIKLGLANLVVITALYSMGSKEAFSLSLLRIILVGFTFGSLSTILFSLAGGLLSYFLMLLSKKLKVFSMVGVSIVGGVAHNIGQIIAAVFIVKNVNLIYYYLPFLLISGAITGTLIGMVGAMITARVKNNRQ
jgi:heptaprenyl diphosphate synthase